VYVYIGMRVDLQSVSVGVELFIAAFIHFLAALVDGRNYVITSLTVVSLLLSLVASQPNEEPRERINAANTIDFDDINVVIHRLTSHPASS
jgi:hypothetical protein